MLITIDGSIGTGKSTVAKRLAEKLGFIYFDTGAMYRCITYGIIKNNVNIEDPAKLREFLDGFRFDIKIYRGDKRYMIDEEDVTDKIRGADVTGLVSRVSAMGNVRDKLMSLQRDLSVGVNAIFEGRDMGTVVFPKANIKVFLTGRPEVRAKRRFDELKAKFPKDSENLTLEQTLQQINQRDEYDSTRELAPLRQAEDALLVDTSDLNPDEVVFKILEYIDTQPAME